MEAALSVSAAARPPVRATDTTSVTSSVREQMPVAEEISHCRQLISVFMVKVCGLPSPARRRISVRGATGRQALLDGSKVKQLRPDAEPQSL